MRNTILVTGISILLLVCSCGKTATEPRHATVSLLDGTAVAGMITATSPADVTITGDDNISRTIPMKQVRSIAYDDAAAAAPPAGQAAAPATEAAHENHYHPPQTAILTKTYQLPVGTLIPVRAEETIDSGKAAEGQTYAAEVNGNVMDADGAVVIPAGSNAQIVIRSASKGGRIRGASDLVLDLKSVSVEGQEYALSTVDLEERGKQGVGANRRTAEYSGGGAAIGAIIGAIAGGGKGAAIGAGAGGGGGALTQILTKGGSVRVPAETVLTFKLDRPLRVTQAR